MWDLRRHDGVAAEQALWPLTGPWQCCSIWHMVVVVVLPPPPPPPPATPFQQQQYSPEATAALQEASRFARCADGPGSPGYGGTEDEWAITKSGEWGVSSDSSPFSQEPSKTCWHWHQSSEIHLMLMLLFVFQEETKSSRRSSCGGCCREGGQGEWRPFIQFRNWVLLGSG